MEAGGASFGGDLPLFFWRVRGHGADWPGPIETALVGMERRPPQVVPIAEPLRPAPVDVNRGSPSVAAVSSAPVTPSRPGAVAARSVAAGRAPSVGAIRSQPPAAVEASGARPGPGGPTHGTPPSPGAEGFVTAPRPVAEPAELNARSLSPVGDIVSRQPQVTTSEPVTPPPSPEPLPLSGRPLVPFRADVAGRSIARSSADVADPPQATTARDAAQPVVRAPERPAAPGDLQRAPVEPDRSDESGARVTRAIPVSSHTSMVPASAPLRSPARSPAASVPLIRGVTPVSAAWASASIPLVALRRSVELPSSSSAGAHGVTSVPPLVSRAPSPMVTAVRIDEARTATPVPTAMPAPTGTPTPTAMPASRRTTAQRRGDESGESPGGSAQPSRPGRAESARISRDIVAGSTTTVTGTEPGISRGASTDVDLRAPLPLSPMRLNQTRPSVTSGEAYEPVDRREHRPATGERELTASRVARSVSRAGGADPVPPAGDPRASQESPDFHLALASERTSVPAAGGQGSRDGGPIGLAGAPSSGMLVTRAVVLRPARARDRDAAGGANHPGALPGALPLYRSGMVSETLARTRDSMASAAERSTPVVAARSVEILIGSNAPSSDGSVVASASQPAAALAVDRSESQSSSGAVLDVFDGRGRPVGQPPMLLALRSAVQLSTALHSAALPATASHSAALPSTAPAPPAIMRAPHHRGLERPENPRRGGAGGSELVLVARTADADGRVMVLQRIGEGVVPSAPAMSAVGGGRPLRAEVDVRGAQAPAPGAKPQIDLDELVEKAWQKLMRKVTIEQERRGYTRWPWQS